MSKEAIGFGAAAALVFLTLWGCGKIAVDEGFFVGTWVNTATTGYSWKSITLNADRTADLVYWNNLTAGPCTWTFTDQKLVVTDQAGRAQLDLHFRFKNAKTLVLSGTPKNVVMTGDGKYIKQ